VRLGVGASRDQLPEIYAELKGCATVADTFEEFLSLATRAITAHGGMVGDVFRHPWPSESNFRESIRDAAMMTDPIEAATTVLDAAHIATDEEARGFLTDPDQDPLRAYVSDLANGLDEHTEQYLRDLAAALAVDFDQLVDALEPS
jgi:hypothetical protein